MRLTHTHTRGRSSPIQPGEDRWQDHRIWVVLTYFISNNGWQHAVTTQNCLERVGRSCQTIESTLYQYHPWSFRVDKTGPWCNAKLLEAKQRRENVQDTPAKDVGHYDHWGSSDVYDWGVKSKSTSVETTCRSCFAWLPISEWVRFWKSESSGVIIRHWGMECSNQTNH